MFISTFMSSPVVAGTHLFQMKVALPAIIKMAFVQTIVDQQIEEACSHHSFVRDREWRDEMELEAASAEYEEEKAQFEAEMKAQFPYDYRESGVSDEMEDEDAVCCIDESCAGCQGFISDEDDLPTESANYAFEDAEDYNAYLAEVAADDEGEPEDTSA